MFIIVRKLFDDQLWTIGHYTIEKATHVEVIKFVSYINATDSQWIYATIYQKYNMYHISYHIAQNVIYIIQKYKNN